ncbi:MAG TPA: lysophospholipid acyltransferase family protein [Verrucomicrobiae bacterium]|nr:lysophospholipid acyltransferase family protein [Verrucomicrobiae bacterium]
MTTERQPFFPFTVLRFLIGYATYYGANFVFITVGGPLLLLLTFVPRAKAWIMQVVVHHYLAFLSRRWLPVLGIYQIAELPAAIPPQPVVYVANHRGFMDAPLLLGLLPRTGVLVKTHYTRWMLPGILARHFDLVAIDPNSRASVQAALERCRAITAAGRSLLVFPEGTRARTGRLGRFKEVAFRLAVETCTPVAPVVIHSTQPFMAKVPGSVFPRRRNVYRIRLLDLDAVLPDDSSDALADRVYQRMARELKELDRGTVWETL